MRAHAEPARIYGPDGELYALVDQIDYAWACQWRWSPKWSRGRTKVYMRRVAHLTLEPGMSKTARLQQTIWLHRAIIIERMQLVPPSALHTMVDHEDGDELNCRRSNLRWATAVENRANRKATTAMVRRSLGL